MENELKPIRCRCGGEARLVKIANECYECVYYQVMCMSCRTKTDWSFQTMDEAVKAWNKVMDKNIGHVIERDLVVTDPDGYGYHRISYHCENCDHRVIRGDNFCSQCGCELIWSDNE